MADALLGRAQALGVLKRVAAVIEHVGKEALVGARQLVANVLCLALGKRCVGTKPFLDIAAAALDEVRDEGLAVEGLIGVTIEAGVEQAEQRAKALLDPAVRRRGDQKNLAAGIAGEVAEQLETLVLDTRSCATRTLRRSGS